MDRIGICRLPEIFFHLAAAKYQRIIILTAQFRNCFHERHFLFFRDKDALARFYQQHFHLLIFPFLFLLRCRYADPDCRAAFFDDFWS